MKFSLFYLPAYDPAAHGREADVYAQILDEAQVADGMGLDTIWLAEHHFSDWGGALSPVPVLLAALTQKTRRIRLGSGGVALPLHKPVELAEQLAAVDVLSGGRLRIGIVRAFLHSEYAGLNIDMGESRARFNEASEIIRGLWEHERFSYDGKFWSFRDLALKPRPFKPARPRMTLGTIMTRESFDYAGANGMDLMVVPYQAPLEATAERIGWYHEALRKAGHDPARFNVMAPAFYYCHENENQAREDSKRAILTYLGYMCRAVAEDVWSDDYKGYQGLVKGIESLMDYDLMYQRCLFGRPEEIRRKAAELEGAGITEVGLVTLMPALRAEQAMRSLRMLPECVGSVLHEGAA